MDRYICIHGHFYQPPRENPWLDEIETQESAHPYENWNERVSAECYEPNAAARILDGEGRIRLIVNNYARISFNFGPTLLMWLERKSPEVYAAILEGDRESSARFGGHGSALAMPFNHMIMPLANERDKITQVRWGLRDFQRRFGRRPEGMWLPETAVDNATLRVMAAEGVTFTILAPSQAARVRRSHVPAWRDVSGARIDPSEPYRLALDGGLDMTLFFYDGPISNSVAFEHLLGKGEDFVERLRGAFEGRGAGARLVNIATDGESYGHHHRFGEMALAYALHQIESDASVRLTNYGEFLDIRPPTLEVEIVENSSWSCAHGIERWRSDCGCNVGRFPKGNQAWRGPMRRAMDQLRDAITPRYTAMMTPLLGDAWRARDAYVETILDPVESTVAQFLDDRGGTMLSESERSQALGLLELQRYLLYMYTSCGWFFDDIGGIESLQCLQYAARALQLAEHLFLEPFEEAFLAILEEARSNDPELGDGAALFRDHVAPARVDLRRVAANFAVWSLFNPEISRSRLYNYSLDLKSYGRWEEGSTRLAIGRGDIASRATRERCSLAFAAFYQGGRNLNAAVIEDPGELRAEEISARAAALFQEGNYSELVRVLEENLGCCSLTLNSLFRNERHKVIEYILDEKLVHAEQAYREIYELNAHFMRFLGDIGMPAPRAFRLAAEYVLHADLRRALMLDDLEPATIARLLQECRKEKIELKGDGISKSFENGLLRAAIQLRESNYDLEQLRRFRAAVILVGVAPFAMDLARVQIQFYRMIGEGYAERRALADKGDASAGLWVELFREIGEELRVRVD